ncbi:MAG: hypothetical protein A2X94_03695 [Bdellovibrionales bacterium GWB1_55_8]|nr:MAG: hypothetical protein A2X94_03695 [Bdellovibrionales bacterium GWB1_55_8]
MLVAAAAAMAAATTATATTVIMAGFIPMTMAVFFALSVVMRMAASRAVAQGFKDPGAFQAVNDVEGFLDCIKQVIPQVFPGGVLQDKRHELPRLLGVLGDSADHFVIHEKALFVIFFSK